MDFSQRKPRETLKQLCEINVTKAWCHVKGEGLKVYPAAVTRLEAINGLLFTVPIKKKKALDTVNNTS